MFTIRLSRHNLLAQCIRWIFLTVQHRPRLVALLFLALTSYTVLIIDYQSPAPWPIQTIATFTKHLRYLPWVLHERGETIRRTSGFRRLLLWTPFFEWKYWSWTEGGQLALLRASCSVWKCFLTIDKRKLAHSDVVLVHLRDLDLPAVRPDGQVWVFMSLESPFNTDLSTTQLEQLDGVFNWSMTYRLDSDIRYTYGSTRRKEGNSTGAMVDYHVSKPNLVVWYVSNCKAVMRLEYARNLGRHVAVHMFGECGVWDGCDRANQSCSQELRRTYKFYLAFENSECDYYVTEKFWSALDDGLVPVVMGATVKQYSQIAPPRSFIHVDMFESPQRLAMYLTYLEKHPDEYNKYHAWRRDWTISHKPLDTVCDLCQRAHNISYTSVSHAYKLSEWWTTDQCH